MASVDIEATGVDYSKDRIIAVAVGYPGTDEPYREWLVDPRVPIPKSATDVNGIHDKDVVGCPHLREVWGEILEFLEGADAVVSYTLFDREFMGYAAVQLGVSFPAFALPWIDACAWSRYMLQELNRHKLVLVAAHLGIHHRNPHKASADAEVCGRVLCHLASRMPNTLEKVIEVQRTLLAREHIYYTRNKKEGFCASVEDEG